MSNTTTSQSTPILPGKAIKTVENLYHYLDDLFEQDSDSDTLFSGGYLRGLFSLVATEFGDENTVISIQLIDKVSAKLNDSKAELSPQDFAIVSNFWVALQDKILPIQSN